MIKTIRRHFKQDVNQHSQLTTGLTKRSRVLHLTVSLGTFGVLYTLTNWYSDHLYKNHQSKPSRKPDTQPYSNGSQQTPVPPKKPTSQYNQNAAPTSDEKTTDKNETDLLLPLRQWLIGLKPLSPKLGRRRVYTLVSPLDENIPFFPAMIVPYSWSFVLFCSSFFMVKTPNQLTLLSRRLILSTALACLFFYFYPARFSYERPEIESWTGLGYEFLNLADKPYNQFPSLHVAYALLLAGSLWPATRTPAAKTLLIMVSALIIISTVFTYQHHVVDVVGGVLLALIVWLAVNRIRNTSSLKYFTVAIAGFLILTIIGYRLSYDSTLNRSMFGYPSQSVNNLTVLERLSWLIALYWLISFLAVSYAYQRPNPIRNKTWFAKTAQGTFTFKTWVLFTPLLSSYRMMWWLGSKSNTERLDRVNDSVTLIATPRLKKNNILGNTLFKNSHIITVDLAAEISSHYLYVRQNRLNIPDSYPDNYLYFPLLDLQSFDDISIDHLLMLFNQCDDLILRQLRLAGNKPIVVVFHCVMGLSRSVAMLVLYKVYRGQLSPSNYLSWVATNYPNAHIGTSVANQDDSDCYLPKELVEQVALNAPTKHSSIRGVAL